MTSKETSQMLKQKKGYRCEASYGSGVRVPSDIVRYEYYDLGNDEDYLVNQMCAALKLGDDCLVTDVFQELEERYDEKYIGLWLATEGEVKRYCGKETPEEVLIPDKSTALVDLGPDGALFLIKKSKIQNRWLERGYG